MYKEWLKEQLKKVETMTAYTIYKAELDRIERIEAYFACQGVEFSEN